MKLAMTINYSGDFKADVQRVQDLERAGLDLVWVPEAYSFDAISQVGFLAAKTSTINIGTGIINSYSRTATAVAQTAAGCDFVSDGRFVLGLGASGPQVIEGFHGVPYDHPMPRILDYINVCRLVWKREAPLEYEGKTVTLPLPAGQGTGLGKALKIINHPVRPNIPIFWASVMGKSVTATARYADGWLPIFFDPTKYKDVWGAEIDAGLAERDPELGPMQMSAGGVVAIGDEYAGEGADAVLELHPTELRALRRRHGRAGPELLHEDLLATTATRTRPSRSRTSTSTARRRRRRRRCLAACSPAATWSAARTTSPRRSPPSRRPASPTSR